MFMIQAALGGILLLHQFKTGFGMHMAQCRGFRTDQNGLGRFRGLRLPFFQAAGQDIVPLIAVIPVGMTGILRNGADQGLMIAGCIMDVVFRGFADQNSLCAVTAAVMAVGLARFPAADHNGFVAAAAMGMVFGDAADQRGGIAVAAMLVALFLRTAGKYRIPAAIGMDMAILGAAEQIAGTVASVTMDMGFRRLIAQQRIGIAVCLVDMVFRQRAAQLIRYGITVTAVGMSFVFFGFADQRSLLGNIAAFTVDMGHRGLGFPGDIAVLSMYMGLTLRQCAHQHTVCVIAERIMAVDQIICLAAKDHTVFSKTTGFMGVNHIVICTADQYIGRCLCVAGFGMGMFLHTAVSLILHGNCRQDQCIGGTEYNQAAHDTDGLLQKTLAAVPCHMILIICL